MNYENKNLATFTIAAPDVGDYFLKIFAYFWLVLDGD